MPSAEKLAEFVAWCQKHITGDEKGQAQIFLDRLFQSFGQSGCLDVGGTTEFRIRKSDDVGGGSPFLLPARRNRHSTTIAKSSPARPPTVSPSVSENSSNAACHNRWRN